jgi:regulatory protein
MSLSRPPPTLRQRALQWLAQREQSRAELRRKLLRWAQARAAAGGAEAPGAGEVDAVLDALQSAGHLSDARFVEGRVRSLAARFGNRRIEAELHRYGTDLDPAARARLRATEADRIRQVWAAKFGVVPSDLRERARQARFLAARGFSSESIRLVLGADTEAD